MEMNQLRISNLSSGYNFDWSVYRIQVYPLSQADY